MAGGGSRTSWFVGDGEGCSSPWLVVVACESGCGGALVVVRVWAVVVIRAPAWALVMGCGGALIVVHVWAAVVVQASTRALIVCAACWGRWGAPRHEWGVPWVLVVVRIRGGVVVALVVVYVS